MLNLTRCAAIAASATLLSVASVQAQSLQLGFTGAELSFGSLSGEETTPYVDGMLDVAITRYHGLQIDLGGADYGGTWIGTLGMHLYMQPSETAKYGLFLAYGDANDFESTTTDIGVEGIWQPSDVLTLSTRLGMGRAGGEGSEMDYVFGSFGGALAVSDLTALTAGLQVLEADEKAQNNGVLTLDMGIEQSFRSAPVTLTAGLSHVSYTGSFEQNDTRVAVGLKIDLGPKRGARQPVSARKFAPVRPLRDLIARDQVWPQVTRR